MFGGSKKELIENKQESTEIFDLKGQSVYIRDCDKYTAQLKGKIIKLAVEACKDCSIRVDCSVITGTIELINCQGVVIELNKPVPTIQISMCSSSSIKFSQFNHIRNVISAGSENLSIIRRSTTSETIFPIELPSSEEEITPSTQFLSRFRSATQLLTERIVREGAGYVTTQREKDIADAKDKRLEAALEEYIKRDLISVSKRPSFPAPTPIERKDTSRVVPDFQASDADKETEEGEEDTNDTPEGDDQKSGGLLAQLAMFNKGKLNPTKTVVRHVVSVTGSVRTGHGHTSEEDVIEYEDSEDVLDKKIDVLVDLITKADRPIWYTGAGVSTSAKIPDYRGPDGAWTRMDKGLAPKQGISIEQALPTYCHMALAKLVTIGKMNFLVSTNLDGLHRRSGLTADNLAELHGNCYLEKCIKCNKEYMRTFDCTKGGTRSDHKTARNCDDCGEPLRDSIINFGESLPRDEFDKAAKASKQGDLAIVLGSSMRVRPACDLPRRVPGKLVIVNLQKTPATNTAWMHIYARTDLVMDKLMTKLGIEVQPYKV